MGVDQMSARDRDSTGSELPADAAGRRVTCDGERATVRYVGPVPPTAGLWLGVEWDNPDRGKHDGSHDGVQYFTCRHPKGGSFVRPGKASFGIDYLTAVREFYRFDVEEAFREEHSISSKTVECVGFQELRFEKLTVVSLSKRAVSGPGADGEIHRTTPDVQTLDLSENLLSCWDDVASITQHMPQLKELMLSHNRLCLPSDPGAQSHAFSSLKLLALTGCSLTWTQILQCAPMWPQLEELCVSQNNITELQRPVDVLQSLKYLDLSSNPLVEDSVLTIAALP
ncbi:tubulin-specific chaperone E-like, partial [Centroberyx affinis]|uniref:tubulin-specific chaperone E-like n=1 Tax=Centroberyx affinis TaxID=166261 RepID=UPI003A5B9D28